MKVLAYLRSFFAALFHRSQSGNELEEELRSHIEHRADDLVRAGMSRAEAERRARVEFGGREKYKEEIRQGAPGNSIETLGQDVRFSLRVLRKSPGFTLTAVLTLALAIGANAVVFGLMDGLLRPLNVPQAESLYGTHYGDNPTWQSYQNYLDLRDRNRSFDELAAFGMVLGVGLDTGKDAIVANGFATTGNYFDVLRIHPFLGRFFHASDEHGFNSAPYIVLAYSYWHSRFQDDRSIVGRTVQLNKHAYTIIGVAPPGFQGTLLFLGPDFFMPIVNEGQLSEGYPSGRSNTGDVFEAFGHLKPGVTPTQAVADVDSVSAYLEKTYPREIVHHSTVLGREGLTSFGPGVRAFVSGLMLLSGLILLAACANLGSLFSARAADRSKEVALRLALGSSRGRILRGVFTEAVMISLAGGAVGLLGSIALLRALSTWQPVPQYPLFLPVTPDVYVYAVALLLALVSGLLFGAVPVRQILRTNPYEVVKAGSTGIVAGNTGRRITLRDVLLVVQIAICAVLVTSSLVAVRGLVRSMHSNFGFDPQNAMLVDTTLSMAGYSDDRLPAMQQRMIDGLAAIPGVKSVGFVSHIPLGGGGSTEDIFADRTTDLKPANVAANVEIYSISPEYFHAAGTALLSGRSLSWQDGKNAPPVAVVNALFARQIFGSVSNAIGRYYKREDGTRVQVVGVVEDGKYYQLTEDPKPATFLPFLQRPTSLTCLVVRSNRDPQQLAGAIRSTLRNLDSSLPLNIQTWTQGLDIALFAPNIATAALGVLGLMGAMLSITGIFGLASYSVSKRLRELGIRIALGAQRKEVLQTALGRPLKLLAIGSAAGLFLGILAAKVLAHIVYTATSRDPLVLSGVVLGMSLLGLLATWIPAQRALSVNPLTLLREE